jgi:parallel beta-helix repeat protein
MLHFLQERLLHSLHTFQTSLNIEICDLRHRQALTEENVDRLKLEQLILHYQYVSTIQDVKNEVAKIATTNDEIPYVFRAPRKNPWFGGRLSELQDLANLLPLDDTSQPKVNNAAVCGLGGVGKTSLAAEFAQQRKDFYTGGVYWFSGEDDTTFENSVYDVATRFGTQSDSFGLTFSATFAKISRNKNPWLIVLDNMDQLSLSSHIVKLVSGPWQHDASGHILIITRRKPTALANDIRDFNEGCCLSLQCFGIEEGKKFLFRRIRIVHDEEMDEVAEKLVKQLGGLPLALEQAGAYIKSLPCTIPQYLELYDSQRLRLLNRQKATSVSVYDSPERLAVRTTWHLNFEHIKQAVDDGMAASRFLYASAFLNPNEIQKDIINIGEPPVEDEEFCECVKTTLGRQQVLKLLTDFSLFKETPSSNLSVHHLVQEVILENLNPEEELKSINDAIRMLHYAFRNCSSPDELFSSKKQEPPSVICGDQSRFYNWHKLCLHSYDLVRHLKRMIKQSNVDRTKIFQPETASIVHECAVHLSANSKHDEAKELASFANDIFNLSNQQVPASSLFPHTIPLPELVRRHIQYSCNAPATSKKDERRDGVEMQSPPVTSEQLEEMRMKGNDLFKKGFYNDALKIYCDAIDISKNTAFFDVRLLSNRASVYLNLGQYDEALQDAEEYILQRPKCWRGYARKALALVELKDTLGAYVAASLAYYHKRNVFRDFEPFKRKFGSLLEMRFCVCRDSSDLSTALWNVRIWYFRRNPSASVCNDLPVIMLESGDYRIESDLFHSDGKERELTIENCILVGGEGECSITFDDNHHVGFAKVFIAYNVRFRTRFSNCHFLPGSIVKLTHCSFESSNHTYTSFFCKGKLKADFCKFHSCTMGGLLVIGDAEIQNTEFYANAVALEVREGGRLVVRRSRMYGNLQGLLIGPQAKECVVEDCEVYDNEWGGIVVTNCASNVVIKGNRSYDNDSCGISVGHNSKVSILENEILSNSDWGISVTDSSQAVVKKNKIYNNQCGGILIKTDPAVEKSVIECNDISFNSGPGICEEGLPTRRRENKLQDNKEERNQSKAQSAVKLCYYCKKPEMNLKKCSKCYTAQYCGKPCQKSDWKNHKDMCYRLLSGGSIVLNYVRDPMMTLHVSPIEWSRGTDRGNEVTAFRTATRGLGLLPVGPKYCLPPNTTTWFIAKISAGISAMSFAKKQEYDPLRGSTVRS